MNAVFLALCRNLVRPDRALDFADMRLAQEKHTDPRLPDAAADRVRQFTV